MQVDPKNEGRIPYDKFKQLVLDKRASERGTSNAELLDAYIAMGGEDDGTKEEVLESFFEF